MTDDDLVGRLIGGRYRVKSRLGAGGMGAVYVALDTQSGGGDKEIALKLIKDQLVDSKEAATRFEREAAALSQIQHANIVQFIGAGVDESSGVRFLAMELLAGRTLKERITSRGSMPWRDTLPIVRGIVCALEAAHARGLIHRDLKPDNVMLVDDSSSFTGAPAVKLLDFGVAKHTTLPEGQTMTGTGMIVGTPGFVAPEIVLHGSSDDPRSDFYALGATWFEMLTGAKPFDAATPFALAMRHVSETPPRPTDLRPFDPVPLPVEALLFKLLAKTPAERPTDAKALLFALDALAEAGTRGFSVDDADTSVLPTMTDMRTPQPGLAQQPGTQGKQGNHRVSTTPPTQVVEFPPVQRHSPTSRLMMAGAVVAIVVALVVVLASQGVIPGVGGSSSRLGSPDADASLPVVPLTVPVAPVPPVVVEPVPPSPPSPPEPPSPPSPVGTEEQPPKQPRAPKPPKQPDAPPKPDILPL